MLACILSTLLYVCECWTLNERDEPRLDAFDMHCQRKILMGCMVPAYYKQLHKIHVKAVPVYGSY